MRISFILPYFSRRPVGGYRVVYEYANRLSKRGHHVTIIEPYAMPIKFKYPDARRLLGEIRDFILRPKSIPWHVIDKNVKLVFPAILGIDSVPPGDAIIATAWNTAEFVKSCPSSKGEKFYLIQHYETWSGPKQRVDATWKANMHKIFISRWLIDIANEMGINDYIHIPNAIDHCKYRLIVPIEKRDKVISMMYSPVYFKGSKVGIAALNKIKSEYENIDIVFFGVKRRPNEIPSWIKYVKDPDQTYLVEEIYNRSSIFICPSLIEGWPLPPAEAMACGCAVATTDCKGIRDYIDHMETGLISPVNDADKLANNISILLRNDELRIKLARAGRDRILSFNWERSTDMFERFLKSRIENNYDLVKQGNL